MKLSIKDKLTSEDFEVPVASQTKESRTIYSS